MIPLTENKSEKNLVQLPPELVTGINRLKTKLDLSFVETKEQIATVVNGSIKCMGEVHEENTTLKVTQITAHSSHHLQEVKIDA